MKLEPKVQEKLSPFTVYGFDVFSAGKASFNTGAIIGIPISFSYKTPKDVDKTNIMVFFITPLSYLLLQQILKIDLLSIPEPIITNIYYLLF